MKHIDIEVNDKKYTLAFSRKSVTRMEENGFDIQDSSTKPLHAFEALVKGSLYVYHPVMKNDDIDSIIDYLADEYGIVETTNTLGELYLSVFLPKGNQEETEEKKLQILM